VARLVLIGLGSNVGDRLAHLRTAIARLEADGRATPERVSAAYETDPVGPPGQGPYLNAAAALRTDLAPEELLALLLGIERAMGRDRSGEPRNGPRIVDLDLLLDGDRRIERPGLSVPHPRFRERGFVLVPLAEIAPGAIDPASGETVQSLLRRLASPGRADPIGPLR